MSDRLNRRRFLGAVLRSFKSGRHDGITRFDSDTFLVETGCLSCAGQRLADGCWELEFVPWSISRTIPGTEEVERMNPTPTLRQRLASAGIQTEFGGDEIFKSLVGQMPGGTIPEDLLRCMREVCLVSPVTDLGCPVRCPRR